MDSETDDPRIRFRVWIAGLLADEVWVDVSNPDADEHMEKVRDRHQQVVEAARRGGLEWMVEIYDPARPEAEAYLRFGDDKEGMVDPTPMQQHLWMKRQR